jgi:lysophospholipase L1-like esterase
MAKTPLHVVVEKIQSGQIKESEASKFFSVAPNPQKPFDFNIGINPSAVDTTNAPSAAALAAPLLRDAGIALDLKRLTPKTPASFKRKLPLIAEGDSWFKLPDAGPITPHALITFLQAKYSTVNIAHWGDTLDDMIMKGQFWPFLQSGDSDVLLFSGGGNDILGGGMLWHFLDEFDVDHAKPSDAPFYLNRNFFDNLDLVMSNYDGLIKQIKARTPNVIMLGHGYDYTIPRPDGPWLGGPMTRQGFNPIDKSDLCEALVAAMIDAFNNRLGALEMAHPDNFKYVDLRGTIKRNEWWDELHPLEAGAKKTAAKFVAALAALPASTDAVTSPFVAHLNLLQATG